MKKVITTIVCVFASLLSMAKEQGDTLFNYGKNWKGGFVFSGVGYSWSQSKMNAILSGNNATSTNLPTIRDVGYQGGFGVVIQHNAYRFSVDMEFAHSKNSNSDYNLQERMNCGGFNIQYAAYRKEAISLWPEIGIGSMEHLLVIQQYPTGNNLGSVVVNPLSVNLYSHAYFVNLALNVGCVYDNKMRDHSMAFVIGYKQGLWGSNWSTDMRNENITTSTHDDMGLVYFGLKINSLRIMNRK